MMNEIASNRCSGPPNAAPAMEINLASVGQGLVNAGEK